MRLPCTKLPLDQRSAKSGSKKMKTAKRKDALHWLQVKSMLDLHFALTCKQFMVLVDRDGTVYAKWKRPKK